MALSDSARVRLLLGESIPPGGSANDTMFTEAQIADFLDLGNGSVERAVYEGWRAKAANFASLVDVTEGNASRAFSDLLKHANDMVKTYARSSSGPTEGRTRIGKIVRL